jgi:predicted GH43/DUF377 family glycosyl hydrolase
MKTYVIVIILLLIIIVVFYCYSLSLANITARIAVQQLQLAVTKDFKNLENEWRIYNPSIFTYQDRQYYVFRVSNSISLRCDILQNLNVLLQPHSIISYVAILAPNGNFLYIDNPPEEVKCPKGYEDARSIIINDNLYLAVNQRYYSSLEKKCGSRMILLEIKNLNILTTQSKITANRELTLTTDDIPLQFHEKNWSPFVYQNELHFVYSILPHIVLKCDLSNGKCYLAGKTDSEIPSRYRGGSQARLWKGMYVSFAHQRYKILYYQSIIYLFEAQPPFRILGWSPEFVFEDNHIAFVDASHRDDYYAYEIHFISGFDIVGDDFHITYGLNDCSSKLCVVKGDEIVKSCTFY